MYKISKFFANHKSLEGGGGEPTKLGKEGSALFAPPPMATINENLRKASMLLEILIQRSPVENDIMRSVDSYYMSKN